MRKLCSYTAIKFLVISLLFIGLTSCCQKKECLEKDYTINFPNFLATELDTIVVTSYLKGTNYTVPVSTFTKDASSGSFYWFDINFDNDIKISISNTKYYLLTDFENEKIQCNKCFPYPPKSEFYKRVKSYYVNGKQQIGRDIYINK